MKKTLITGGLIISLIGLFNQQVKAQYILNKADEEYNLFDYSKAVNLYIQAYKKKATAYAAGRVADCYRLTHDYSNAEKWYAKVAGMKRSKPEATLNYAEALRNNSKYMEARDQYQKYAALNKVVTPEQLRIWVGSCDSALTWMKHPSRLKLTNERALNSPESDWGAVKYKHWTVFTSDRIESVNEIKKRPFLKFDGEKLPDKNNYGWTGNAYLKLYQSKDAGSTKDSVAAFPFTSGTDYHMGAASFTADGNEVYFTLTKIPQEKNIKGPLKTTRIALYSSKKDSAGNWEKPVSFRYNSAEKYSVGDPFITPDGKCLYFVADMPGGKGGTDIYYCFRNINKEWDAPVNLEAANTPGNERTPAVDGKGDFYFSSDGRMGFGGLDVFKALILANKVSQVKNMGYPVNSSYDDFAFTTTSDTTGYLSSDRTGGLGKDDIYSFVDKPVRVKLHGSVVDENGKPVVQTIVSLQSEKTIELKTDSAGIFNALLKVGNTYHISASKTGYTPSGDTLNTKAISNDTTLNVVLKMNKIKLVIPPVILKMPAFNCDSLRAKMAIGKIYFDFDKSVVRPEAKGELARFVDILKINPKLKLMITSYCDGGRKARVYNMALSLRRSKAARAYLLTQGISLKRIQMAYFDKSGLVNRYKDNEPVTETDKQLDRRSELSLLKDGKEIAVMDCSWLNANFSKK